MVEKLCSMQLERFALGAHILYFFLNKLKKNPSRLIETYQKAINTSIN